MKNSFYKLSLRTKLLIHLIMVACILIIIPLIFMAKENSWGILLWIFFIFTELVLIILSVVSFLKHTHEKISAKKASKETIAVEQKEVIEIEEETGKNQTVFEIDYELPDLLLKHDPGFILKYRYNENLCFCENLNSIEVLSRIGFKQEPENDYDHETVAAYFEGRKIGLLYKGDCRDLLNKCFQDGTDTVVALVKKIDVEKQLVVLMIGFYEPINKNNVIRTSLIKTNKIDFCTGETRQKQIELLSEKDVVILEESYEDECLIVKSEYGDELGELTANVSKKILSKSDDVSTVSAYVSKLEYDVDSDKTKAELTILL